MITPADFTDQYQRFFGPAALLPVALSYSDTACGNVRKTLRCVFTLFKDILNGEKISLDAEHINCMGGKYYTGFEKPRDAMYTFVAEKEKYKQDKNCARDSIEKIGVTKSPGAWLNLTRADQLESFAGIEGLIFLVNPDALCGLFVWANYDTTDINTVQAPWGSGCSEIITALVNENRKNGRHCFIGLLDPSARVYFASDILSFSIPMSRFAEMSDTLDKCCIAGSPAWEKLRERINGGK